jgi:hypothetical protein
METTNKSWSIDAEKAGNNLVISDDSTGDVVCEVVSEPGVDPVALTRAAMIATTPNLRNALRQLESEMTANGDGELLYADWLEIIRDAIGKTT